MNEWIWVHFTLGAVIIAWCDASHSDCCIWCHSALAESRCPYTWSSAGWKAGDKQETGTGQIIMSKKQEIPSSHLTFLAWDHPAGGMFYLLRIWQMIYCTDEIITMWC